MKRLISLSLALLMVLSLFLMAPAAHAEETEPTGYYYDQLDANTKKIYDLLGQMSLKTGTHTVDLVAQGVLPAGQVSNQETVMAAFTAARDAFMFDNPDLFYVDFEKISISVTQKNGETVCTMGVGRDVNYFRTGFDRSNVEQAVQDFDAKVSAIAATANAKTTQEEKLKAAYEGVMHATSYALEAQAAPANVNYVRTPYGALVKGQSVCEGYARALKAVLDEMGIESVLVQGYYNETIAGVLQGGPHMWNYVKMDDNRWYLLDATMDDGNSLEHFLLPGTDDLLLPYQAEGMLSPSDVSIEFYYPTLSPIAYQPMTQAFTVTGESYDAQVSYRGMGILASRNAGYYLLGSYDGTSWYYIENHLKWMLRHYQNQSHPEDVDLSEYDMSGYFINYPGQYAYLAVTQVSRPTEFVAGTTTSEKPYYAFDINSDSFFDVTQIGEAVDLKKSPPYVLTRTPNTTSLKDGEEVNVTVTYSENLTKLALSTPDLLLRTTESDAKVSNFVWNESTPNQISFTMTAGKGFGQTVNYFLYLSGLVGAESRQTPDAIVFSKYHLPDFSCPKVLSDINNIHSNVPALISDSDLSADGWKYADGTSVGENLPFELALVASELPSAKDYEELPEGTLTNELMQEKVEEASGETVLASKTYNISLSLCSGQISYIQGRRVKVFVPFPAGYSYDDINDVSFKAYHYNEAEKKMEEIDCVVVEGGIIMMCNAFSPFTVVAVEKEAVSRRSVMTHADGNGSFSEELVWLGENDVANITVTAKSGYKIESVSLNGVAQNTSKLKTVNDQVTIPVAYNDLKDSGNVLEASFVLEEISTEEPDMDTVKVTPVVPETGITLTAPEGGWVLGQNTFTVESDKTLVVAVSTDSGATYTRLTGNGSSYTVTLTGDSRIMAGILGDANNDGAVDASDLDAVKAACLKEQSPNAQGVLLCDMNKDGNVNILDLVQLKIALPAQN